jgi:hypothetical protein
MADTQFNEVYIATCNLALEIMSKENTTGKGLNILPALLEKIIQMKSMLKFD